MLIICPTSSGRGRHWCVLYTLHQALIDRFSKRHDLANRLGDVQKHEFAKEKLYFYRRYGPNSSPQARSYT